METLERTGLTGAAVNELREAILEGRLVQGERLSEVNLSTTLGVSRAPVREALLHLEQEGLVVSLPYKGASVVTLSPQDFLELSTLRTALERLAWSCRWVAAESTCRRERARPTRACRARAAV